VAQCGHDPGLAVAVRGDRTVRPRGFVDDRRKLVVGALLVGSPRVGAPAPVPRSLHGHLSGTAGSVYAYA
jgi:hypothetical protein